jgi:subtilisin
VSAALARALARTPAVLNMDRNQARSDAIVALARQSARKLGFAAKFEGSGILA